MLQPWWLIQKMLNPTDSSQRRPLIFGGASFGLGVFAWWGVVKYFKIEPYILPSPWSVVQRGYELFSVGAIQPHIYRTLYEVLVGGGIGGLIGIVAACCFSYIPIFKRLLMPIVVIIQVTPKISIAPLIVLWLGLGVSSKITLVALVMFYPVLINMMTKLSSVPTSFKDLAIIIGMNPIRRALKVDIPFAFPALASGLKLGILQGITASVIGQFIGATAGLGFLEIQAQEAADTRLVIVCILLLSFLGYALYSIVALIEKRVARRYA